MSKHTPAPWILSHEADGTPYVCTSSHRIADIYVKPMTESVPTEQGQANAKLISAAPDLLSAIETLVKLHHDWDKGRAYVYVEFYEKNKAAIAAARAAIAKATE